MVKKKSKQLVSQNCSERSKRPQGSIKKYCTEKNINKKKNLHNNIRKNEYLRTKKMKNSIHSTSNVLHKKNNKRKKSLLNIPNDITFYEIKPLSPTKLSISVKKFYNNNNFKQYQENLHSCEKKKIRNEEKTINKYKNSENVSTDVEKDNIFNDRKETIHRSKNKIKRIKPYDMIPQLNKEQCKQIKKSNNKTKAVEVYHRDYSFENHQTHLNSLLSKSTNEAQTNEYIDEEYRVTQLTNNALSISVKRFYKSKNDPKIIDIEKINRDMPLVSDTTFNSKAEFNQSPISSKLNSSHKISLNVQCISDNSNNKQQKVTAFFPIRRSARKTKNIVNEEKQIALEKAIASKNEDGLKIAVFPNKGRGVIADRDFTRGEYVVEYSGELVGLKEARKRESVYSKDTTTGCYMYYFKYGSTHYCIDATAESSRLGRLVNHSRFGNLGPKVVEVFGLPKIVLTAKTDIKQGEELTYDYGDRSKESLINHPWLAY